MKVHTNFPLENAEAELEGFLKEAPGMLGDYDFTPSMLRYAEGHPMEGRFVEPCVESAWMMYQVRARQAHGAELSASQLSQLQLSDVQRLDALINGLRPAGSQPSSLADLVAQFENLSTLSLHVPRDLAGASKNLIKRFAEALARKMRDAEMKYGRGTEWNNHDWQERCGRDLLEHLKKGDPRDVAIHCAFMWYHGWDTSQIKGVNSPGIASIAEILNKAIRDALSDCMEKLLNDPALLAALTNPPATLQQEPK